MATPREPWIKLKLGTRRSDKVAGLPNDSARLGYVWALLEAKVQRRMGVFASRAHVTDVLGRHGKYFDDYVTAGLFHVAPLTCLDCTDRNPDVHPGEVVIHDYIKEQRDPTNADRQAHHRNAPPNADRNGAGNGDHNAGSNGERNAPLTRARNDGDGDSDESLSRENRSSPDSRERADVQALLDRGWKRVTAAQQTVLDEVLDRHDVTGAAWAARIIAEAPADADPLAAVKAADAAWQREQREVADRADEAWQAEKAAERNAAGAVYADVFAEQS